MLKKGCGCNKSTNVTPELPKDWGIPKIDLNPIKPDCNQLRKPWDCPDILPAVLINNNPDNEDITSVIEGNLEVLKFADKAYNPMTYSGMGRVFLRKNLVDDDTTLSCPSKVNKLELWMFNDKDGQPLTNTIFIVLYDYDLKGGFITIPCNSILLFLGGSFNNGTVVLTDTLVLPHMLEYSKYMNCAIKGSFAKGLTFYSDGVIKVWNGVSWVEFAGSTEFTELLDALKDELIAKINKNTTDILTISTSLSTYALNISDLLRALSNKINNDDNLITINGRTLKKGDSITIQGDTPLGGVSLNDVLTEIRKLNLNHTSNNIQLKYGNDLLNEVNDNTGSGGGGGDSSDDGLPGNILIYFLKTSNSTVPSTPADGQIANLSSSSGNWQKNAPNHEPGTYIWMSLIYETPAKTYGNWSTPVLIDDDSKGSAGSDTTDREYIYALSNVEDFAVSGTCDPSALDPVQTDGFIPCPEQGDWKDNPQGVSQEMRFEFISVRTKNENGWSKFSYPALWSSYGLNGTDGDGVEYIFYKGFTAPLLNSYNPLNWYTNDDSKAGRSDRYGKKYNSDEYILQGTGWTDNPQDMDPGENTWVSVRKYRNDSDSESSEATDSYWHQYSAPTLWAKNQLDIENAGVLSFDNDEMGITLNEDENNNDFIQSSNAYIYKGGGALTITNLTCKGLWEGDSVVWSEDEVSNYVSIANNKTVTVSIRPNTLIDIKGKTFVLKFTATADGIDERTGTIKLIGLNIGTDGISYRLITGLACIKKGVGTQTGSYYPDTINPKVVVTQGNREIRTIDPSDLSDPLSIDYFIDDDVNPTSLNDEDSISIENRVQEKITIRLLYGETVIDQETIFVINDGIQGISATVYNIIPLSFNITNTELNTGQLTFKVSRKYGDQEVLYLQGGEFVKTEESGATESAEVKVELNGTQSINERDITENNGVYTVSNISFNGNYNMIVITLLVGQSETEMASIVVPIPQAGSDESQTLNPGILRDRSNIMSSESPVTFYDGRNPDLSNGGIYYQDFIRWNGHKSNGDPDYDNWGTYLCITKCDIVPNEIPNSNNFVKLDYSFGEVVSYLIADRAFIDNLASKQVIITDGNNNVVAGMTSGSKIPTVKSDGTIDPEGSGTNNSNGIRIWAGVPSNGGDINTAPFTVDSSGHVKATDADITGQVKATEFQTGNIDEYGIVVLKRVDNEKSFFSTDAIGVKANTNKAYMYYNGESMNIAIYVGNQWKNLDLTNALLPILGYPTVSSSYYYKFTKLDDEHGGFTRELVYIVLNENGSLCYQYTNDSEPHPITSGTLIYKTFKSWITPYKIVYVDTNKNISVGDVGLYQKCSFNGTTVGYSTKYTIIGPLLQILNNLIYSKTNLFCSYDLDTDTDHIITYLKEASFYATPLYSVPGSQYEDITLLLYRQYTVNYDEEDTSDGFAVHTIYPNSETNTLTECTEALKTGDITEAMPSVTTNVTQGIMQFSKLEISSELLRAPFTAADIKYPSNWTDYRYTDEDFDYKVVNPEPIAP